MHPAHSPVRNFDMGDAKTWFPVSFLLVAVIYTGSKSLVGTRSALPDPTGPKYHHVAHNTWFGRADAAP